MTEEPLAEMIRLHVSQLEERMVERHRELREKIDELRADQEDWAGAVLARLDAHEEYHQSNEHRWGLFKLAGRHPFRLSAFVAICVFAFSGTLPGLTPLLGQTLERIAGMLF